MTHEPVGICFWTSSGTYVVNESRPWSIALNSLEGTRMVRESYFTLLVNGAKLSVSDVLKVEAGEQSYLVSYYLSNAEGKILAEMLVTYDFTEGRSPKATAELVDVLEGIGPWQVVWTLVPHADALIYDNSVAKKGALLRGLPGTGIAPKDLKLEIGVDGQSLLLDWTDANSGALEIQLYDDTDVFAGARVDVAFPEGQKLIDPTQVCTSSNSDPLDVSCQRKVFWYNGYYWLFYNSGTAICYRNSADGATWSSEYSLPGGTSPRSGLGFDVASKNGLVGVNWQDTNYDVYFKKGVISGNKIIWSSSDMLFEYVPVIEVTFDWPACTAIGNDGSFFVNYGYRLKEDQFYYFQYVDRSFTGEPGTFVTEAYWYDTSDLYFPDYWFSILPISSGNVALVYTTYNYGAAEDETVSVRYDYVHGWTTPTTVDINMASGSSPTYKGQNFSAVASLNGTVHIAYKGTDGNIRYACIYPSGASYNSLIGSGLYYPTISLDGNGVLHVYYVVAGNPQTIYHRQKPEFGGSWSSATLIYTGPSGQKIRGLTSCMSPVGVCSLSWSEDTGTTRNVKFASVPLPFGTAGSPSDPWNRDGLSPYGTYFAMNSDYISPGSGLMTMTTKLVSIPGRAGSELGVSLIYQQPKYFWNSNGTAYGNKPYPFCNLGPYWSLDLPWMDQYYVYLANGQRYVISWGNNGNSKEFVCHDSVHFVLRDCTKDGGYYELVNSQGVRYRFEKASPYKLTQVSDLDNYNPASSTYTVPYNCLNFTYSSNVLQSITESGLARSISFTYTSGLLTRVTRPDGKYFTLAYTSSRLTSITDPLSRVTSFAYNSTANYCLGQTTFPTGGTSVLTFASDTTPSTEMNTWMVTSESIKNGSAYIRKTSFDYKIVNGKVTFCKVSNYDEGLALKGSNEYIFQSAMKCSTETAKDSSGAQMSKKVTWYDLKGQPARVDTYLGSSDVLNSSSYTNYDDWGNVIFTRDALGHESYSSYANTSTQNSFQGGEVLTRTSTGKILYDAFDDWEFADWTKDVPAGSATLDGSKDPVQAPAVKVSRTTSSGNCLVSHSITAQSSPFYWQASYLTSSSERSYILGLAAGSIRVYFCSSSGYFQYYTGSAWVNVASCSSDTWYDLGFYVRYSNSTYDVYLDGKLVKCGATLTGSGNIDTVRFQSGYSGGSNTNIWFDNIRVYSSLSVTVNGLDSSYITELYDSRGTLMDRSETSTLSIPALPLFAPPAFIKVIKLGNYTFSSPMADVWGGDVYSLSKGFHKSSLPKLTRGFGLSSATINDDAKPTGSTEVWSVNGDGGADLIWVDDASTGTDFSVSGSKYHASRYVCSGWYTAVHYHGFTGATSGMTLSSSDILTQYVWLEDGKMPMEIAIQIYANSAWRRAYWVCAGSTDIIDIDGTTYDPTVKVSCGSLPSTTGQWVQLTVKASDLGITSSGTVTGVIYAMYGGTARWDLTSKYTEGVVINGLTSGYKVKMTLDNKTVVQGTATSSSLTLTPMSPPCVVRAYPVGATFEVQDSTGKTLYLSPRIPEVYNRDQFTYSSNGFYVNSIKDGLHGKQVGSYTNQIYTGISSQESYIKYDVEGNAIESKTKLGAGWVYTRSEYDKYGNQLWSADETGRKTVSEFSASNKNTFPVSSIAEDRVDFFDFDTTWTSERSGSGGYTYWFNAKYSANRSYSPDKSLELAFSNGPMSYDTCVADMYKEFQSNRVEKISLKLFVDTYSHNGNAGDTMDSGVKMRLYDSAGSNYATYIYWLACWSGATNNKTVSSPSTTKCVWGQPAMSTWLTPTLYPNTDFTIDWSSCVKVRFDVYTYGSYAYGDYFRMYVDDLTFNDLTKEKTTFMYDTRNGRAIASTDPCGHTTSQWYDAVGRVIRTNNSDATYRTVTYDDINNKATAYDELSRKTISYYDKIGRTIKMERYGTWTTLYSVIKQTYNWQDKVATSTDAANRVTTYTYDYLGRVTSVKNPDNSISYTTYDDKNKLVTTLDELSHKTVNVLDDLGRLNQTREYVTASTFYTTKMSYNAVGQLLTIRQDNGEVTRMYYDSLGRQTTIAYPDSKSESYTYDEAGRVLTATARSGQVTTNAYDTARNNIRVIGTSDTIRTKYNADGLVSEKVNSLGNISYIYNNRDLLYRLVQKVSPNSYSFTYTYNAAGDVVYVDYPDARRITYLYDRVGRAVDVKMGNTLLLNVTYNIDDTVSVKKYCNSNSSLSYFYNTNGFVSKIRGANVTSGAVFLNLNYNYTADGDVANIKDTAGTAGNEYYWYDNLGRLTKAMANSTFGTIMYGYSSVGNRIWKNEAGVNRTYWYNLSYNKMNAGGGYSYDYDANGNVIWKNQTNTVRYNYIYNSFGQMTEVKRQTYSGGAWGTLTTVAKYYYDANGARAKTDEGGTIFRYVYSGHDPIYYNGSDGKGHKDIYMGGQQEIRIVSSSEKWAYMADALGSTRKVLQNGRPGSATFTAVTYKPFGPVVTSTGSDKFTYAGEMQDSPTGLVYLSARYYDPEIGRFYALDPELGKASLPQTLSRYVYCVNSPMLFTDPDGHFFNLIAAAIGAAAGAIIGGVVTYALTGDVNAAIGGAIGGAAAGALAGFTCGASLAVTVAGQTAMSALRTTAIMSAQGFISSSVSTLWTTGGDVNKALNAGIMGAVTGVAAGAIGGTIARPIASKIMSKLPVGEKDIIGRAFASYEYKDGVLKLTGYSYKFVRYDVTATKFFSTEMVKKAFSAPAKKGFDNAWNNLNSYFNVNNGVDVNRMY